MHMMEVDKHSPTFRKLRSYSTKRARSPDTSPTNRPLKRLSLAVHGHLTSAVDPQTKLPSSQCDSSNSSRHPSEDWVQQAGGLTIDSPQPGDGPFLFPNTCAITRDVEEDEHITIDADEDMDESSRRTSGSLSLTSTPFLQQTSSNPSGYPPHREKHQSLSDPTTQYPAPPQSTLQFPSINTTASDSPLGSNIQNAESAHPTTRPSSPTDMAISPNSSWNANTISANSRKQRFTMGPRADCEKCLLGVKGHWMHFD